MNSNRIFGLPDSPTADNDATSKKYVDASINIVKSAAAAAQTTANSAVDAASAAQTTANTATTKITALTTATSLGTATAAAQYLYPALGSEVALYTGPLNENRYPRLYVTPAGNIGIGTTVPYANTALDVRGIIYCSDRLGIGTSTPNASLHVSGSGSNTITGTGRYWDLNANTGTASGSTWAISIITENSIWNKGQHNWLTSDQRIKTNIVNLNADKMMNIFRNLRPISFDYIDPMKNGNKKHFGFIAQEIKEILPEGISLNTDVIPNNMMKGEIDPKSKIDASFTLKPDDTDISLNYLLLKTDTSVKFDTANPYNSTVYKFKVYCGEKWAKEQDIYIRSDYNVIDDKYTYVIGMKKDVYDIVITEPTLFIYGQYVYDLHILDHDTIYTVATAALQEVDRQQQADKVRIAELEAKVSIFESKMVEQQSLINDILDRLKTLEKA
jgi:hypothetical protein